MSEANQIATNKPLLSVGLNAFATFLVSISMGMNAVLFPVTMENNGIETSMIGTILSLETIASLLMCFFLPHLLKIFGMRLSLILVTLFRVPPLFFLGFTDETSMWVIGIFFHGVGSFTFLILLQVWVNSIQFKKNAGLMIALYSTAISLGLAGGPFVLSMIDSMNLMTIYPGDQIFAALVAQGYSEDAVTAAFKFVISALFSTIALLPILFGLLLVPKFQFKGKARIMHVVMQAKGPMFAIAMAGVSIFGVTAFITLYGIRNGLSLVDASFLLTSFMIGSLVLETPLTWLSDYFDRRYMIVISAFLCMVCAVYLPIAIYESMQAWILVFIWGGVVGAIYSTALALIGEKFSGEELVVANAGYSIMDAGGGTIGILMIGFFMDLLGPDGLPYVIMFASIVYFSFALTRYRVV